MSEQPPQVCDGSPERGESADLDAYVAANAGRFTDDVLYSTLVAAGHSPEAVRSALTSASASFRPRSAAPQAVLRILLSYGAVFALLSVGMLLNRRPAGYLMPDAEEGIRILAVSLGVALVASVIWVGSRRFFALGALALFVAYVLGASTGIGLLALLSLVAVLVVGGVALMRRPKVSGAAEASLALLLAIPLLMLLVVGGICLASGLPIPGGS